MRSQPKSGGNRLAGLRLISDGCLGFRSTHFPTPNPVPNYAPASTALPVCHGCTKPRPGARLGNGITSHLVYYGPAEYLLHYKD